MNVERRQRSGTTGRLTRRVAGLLRERVRQAQPGDALPPAETMAEQFRCSMTTLRHALAVVRQEGLITTTHGVGSFVADAREPAGRGATGLLFFGTISSLVLMGYAQELVVGMLEEADACSRRLELMPARRGSPAAVRIADFSQFTWERVDTAIALAIINRQALRLLGSRMPTVSVDFECHEPGVSSCALDHAGCIRKLVDPLWLLGHRRIAFIGPVQSTDPAHAGRRDALLAELRSRGVAPRPEWIIESVGTAGIGGNPSPVADNFLAIPKEHRPTAIISDSTVVDWMLLAELHSRGVRVPQDVSFLAIDLAVQWLQWVRQLSENQAPLNISWPVASIDPMDERYVALRSAVVAGLRQPFRAMGHWAVREAERRAAEPGSEPAHKLFESEFLPGSTLAPPPTG